MQDWSWKSLEDTSASGGLGCHPGWASPHHFRSTKMRLGRRPSRLDR